MGPCTPSQRDTPPRAPWRLQAAHLGGTQEFPGFRKRQESGRDMLQTAPRDALQAWAWLGTAGRQFPFP